MDGFVQSYRASGAEGEACRRVMGYFGRDMQPASWRLAETHVLCQRWFCSVLGPTWPNRLYSHAATSNGARGNDVQDDRSMPTIYHRLDEAGIPWADYSGNAPFLLLFPGLFSPDRFYALEDFAQDALHGALPRLTVVEPIYGRNDDHPPTHPLAGQILIQTIYEALARGPHWNRCALIVTYDEHGGFADHVAPPTTADGRAAEGFDRMGVRVPAFVISPYSKRGHVSSTVFDHSSYPAFLERLWGLQPLTERDAAANDLWDLFDMDRVARRDPAPPIELDPIVVAEEEIYAPECLGGGIARDGRGVTLQPDLEDLLDALPSRHPADRRAETSAVTARFMESARSLGVWRPR
jgi:phospholipase C